MTTGQHSQLSTQPAAATVAIDIGTTKSRVACLSTLSNIILPQDFYVESTPSYACYLNGEWHIGDEADQVVWTQPQSFVRSSKLFIGKQYSDKSVQEIIKKYRLNVALYTDQKQNSSIAYIVNKRGENEKVQITSEYVTHQLASAVKQKAQAYLKTQLLNSVVIVSASFSYQQRVSTIKACKKAGLQQVKLIDKTTAAALYYAVETQYLNLNKQQYICVTHFGADALEMSVIAVGQQMVKIQASYRHPGFGGENVTLLLTNSVLEKFYKRANIDYVDQVTFQSVYFQCEKAKIQLFHSEKAEVFVPQGLQKHVFSINRSQLKALTNNFLQQTFALVKRDLKHHPQAKILVPVGSSFKLPHAFDRLRDVIKIIVYKKHVYYVDDFATFGAAILASVIDKRSQVKYNEQLPLSIGFALHGGEMEIVVQRETLLPVTKQSQLLQNIDLDQNEVQVDIYEGERMICGFNMHLGSIKINDIPILSGAQNTGISFDINWFGRVSVTFFLQQKNIRKIVLWQSNLESLAFKLSSQQIQKLVSVSTKHQADDLVELNRLQKLNDIHLYLQQIQKHLNNGSFQLVDQIYVDQIKSLCSETLSWVQTGKHSQRKLAKKYANLVATYRQIVDLINN